MKAEEIKRWFGCAVTLLCVGLFLCLFVASASFVRLVMPVDTITTGAFVGLNLVLLVFWLWMVADSILYQDAGSKPVITLLVVFTGMFGALVYFWRVVWPRQPSTR